MGGGHGGMLIMFEAYGSNKTGIDNIFLNTLLISMQ